MSTLHFKKIDEEQSEAWRNDNARHLVSTEGIRLAVQQLCDQEIYERFWASYPVAINEETSLEVPNSDSIAGQLELR
jgi:hypothetical protein